MAIQADGNLYIYVLNVGQGDASVIVTPNGNIIIIDARAPDKLVKLLKDLGLKNNEGISFLIITHPHTDHFSGAARLINEFSVKSVIMAPFWIEFGLGLGPPTYRNIVNELEKKGVTINFVSGYTRFYPDKTSASRESGVASDALYLELLGPPNFLLEELSESRELDTNHLSILSRINWKDFRMVSAGDAQMENWAYFDQEGMLEHKCYVLKSAHHGSCNGTQWERLYKLKPKYVIVSSDPAKQDHLPDLIGTAIFAKYSVTKRSGESKAIVGLTKYTGSIRIKVQDNGTRKVDFFGDTQYKKIDLTKSNELTWETNPTKWQELLNDNVNNFISNP